MKIQMRNRGNNIIGYARVKYLPRIGDIIYPRREDMSMGTYYDPNGFFVFGVCHNCENDHHPKTWLVVTSVHSGYGEERRLIMVSRDKFIKLDRN